MITNYYTLHALIEAWSRNLPGCVVGDVYSQARDELTVALASPDETWMLRASTRLPLQYLFRGAGYNKARKNVAALFPNAIDCTVSGIRLAERDRVVFVDLEGGMKLQFMLFGPNANVLLVDGKKNIVDAFQRKEALLGQPAPAPMPAPDVTSLDALKARWRTDRKNTVKAITTAFPFFNAELAQEAVLRMDILPDKPADCTDADLQRILETATAMDAELRAAAPRIYWRDHRAVQFSMISIHHDDDIREERFESTDKAVAIYTRRRLGQQGFDEVFNPLEKTLQAARNGHRKRLDNMLASLSKESRAGKYERWGHLLMAAQAGIPRHTAEIQLEDLFDTNKPITIPLDPALGAVDNAQRYYTKARNTRASRLHAEERLEQTEKLALEAEALLQTLREQKTRADVLKFEKAEAKRLARFLGHQASRQPQVPFRRYELDAGYEVWVGKNAKQNDALTFQHARKFDFWLHARGVPGSHTVLRRPNRTAQPPKHILETAAAIAAHHSKARGSHLVPVIVTERKYVRKPKGAPVGTVIVEKEQVILISPKLPVAL